jgi:hypothetical protein
MEVKSMYNVTLVKVIVIGNAAMYVAMNSIYNIEGGHHAIVFNYIEGIKDKVQEPLPLPTAPLLYSFDV